MLYDTIFYTFVTENDGIPRIIPLPRLPTPNFLFLSVTILYFPADKPISSSAGNFLKSQRSPAGGAMCAAGWLNGANIPDDDNRQRQRRQGSTLVPSTCASSDAFN